MLMALKNMEIYIVQYKSEKNVQLSFSLHFNVFKKNSPANIYFAMMWKNVGSFWFRNSDFIDFSSHYYYKKPNDQD